MACPTLLLIIASTAAAGELRFVEEPLAGIPHRQFRDALMDQRTLVAWGDAVWWTSLPENKARLSPAGHSYSQGGAVMDVDGNGQPDLVLCQTNPPRLVWLNPADWTSHTIAEGLETSDILAATILGHRGVLVAHKQMQVRFYEVPRDLTKPWPAHDLYSFYTPSREGGLAMADIDGDGLPDILCGNDWIRSPKAFDLHWRLFAINLWNEEENSAMLRLAYGAGVLVAGQREMSPARLAWFEKPAGDPTPQWPQHAIGGNWDRIHSVELGDFDGDGKVDLLVGDAQGVTILRGITGERVTVARGPAVRAFAADISAGGRPDVVLVRRNSISRLRNASGR